ncbi:MAG: hypothetical protein M3Q07_14010, partial [Pseudobdellovibrionaceae bacterium]|nr:hypothetical protein [Pseudobdellovibrionaceae bacterium]
MVNTKLFLAVALFAVACQNAKDSKSSEESNTAPVTIGVEMSEVASLSLAESAAIPQRGMITCVDNRFPFIQVAFVNSVATIIRDKSDTFLGNLDSCTLKLTQFSVDGASYDLTGGYGIGVDRFEHKDENGVLVASKLVRSGILLGLSTKADCTQQGQDCTSYSANFIYSQINSSSKSISNDLRVNQLSM